jgi:hypothetical protein
MNDSSSALGALRALHLTRRSNDRSILLTLSSLLAGTPKEPRTESTIKFRCWST